MLTRSYCESSSLVKVGLYLDIVIIELLLPLDSGKTHNDFTCVVDYVSLYVLMVKKLLVRSILLCGGTNRNGFDVYQLLSSRERSTHSKYTVS